MAVNQALQSNAEKTEKKGATEDPPSDLVKQNEPGKEKTSEIKVPKEALENYKQSGREGEE
ncbi:hypothetical protein FC093_16680 [Ilyomonas limi]|uniref:Uncharacterized protein n=1 Tax=Ilyomonas limi TaxID=2575867 RepID=A0A4U3KVW1_9BACT|nr:hypothetical protein [Ilyomonas limi]TKK66671.1 hypothetical protein FC093_16680 [Ilyomonas limi]